MYKRFLNNNDYIGIITEEALLQLIRGKEERLAQAEEAAEESIIEYLIDNYQIEETLAVGKNILEYNRQIIYPVGAYFYKDGKIWEAMRSVNGIKSPFIEPYWEEVANEITEPESIPEYSQVANYQPNDIVHFANTYYKCVKPNGIDFNDIRVPAMVGWEEVQVYNWQANIEYALWEAVSYNGRFYALISDENIDLTVNPAESDNWGLIGEYDSSLNNYEYSDHEYVVYEGKVFVPCMEVNADELKEGYNIRKSDPRNANVKKHLLRLALYELHKLISPNNISTARITDYETSIIWLRDASRLKINPKIPRKLDDENKPATEYAISTFQRDYDPYKNPWQI